MKRSPFVLQRITQYVGYVKMGITPSKGYHINVPTKEVHCAVTLTLQMRKQAYKQVEVLSEATACECSKL